MATPRQNLMLAALNSGSRRSDLSPVQTQKLFFLIDREAAEMSGGPWFNFQPYDYGPYDVAVYNELENLSRAGFVEITSGGRFRTYRLTDAGKEQAAAASRNLSDELMEYIGRAKDWVTSVDFRTLVSSVYAAYPDTKVNSIFRS